MHLLNTIRPSVYQKKVLAKIAGAATPKLAAAAISMDQNIKSARDMLAKLGAITFAADAAALTPKGIQLAADENITDDAGQLTDVGNQLNSDGDQQQPAGPEADPGMGISDSGGLGDLGMGESHAHPFGLLRELLS